MALSKIVYGRAVHYLPEDYYSIAKLLELIDQFKEIELKQQAMLEHSMKVVENGQIRSP